MLNKEWRSLNAEPKSKKLKRGHLAEYYAEMQLILYGFETYKTTVDDRGIDLIIRNKNGVFFDIQVKSVIDYHNIPILQDKFNIKNERLYLLAVHFVKDGEDPEMYIIPATRWTIRDKIFYTSKENVKKPQYGLKLTSKENCDSLQEYKLDKIINVIKEMKK